MHFHFHLHSRSDGGVLVQVKVQVHEIAVLWGTEARAANRHLPNVRSSGKLPLVTLRLLRCNGLKLRAFIAAALFCAVAVAIGLSAAPQLHNWLHNAGDRPNHECAATLLSSGSVDHSACGSIATEPQRVPSIPAFPSRGFPRVIATLPFSLLEHAPPAQH